MKRILILTLVIVTVFSFFYCSMATVTSQFGGKNMSTDANGKKIINVLSIILEVVRNLGIGIALIILIVLGCKYMLASAGERAEIKKHATTYIIGAIVLVASAGIAQTLMLMTEGVFSNG